MLRLRDTAEVTFSRMPATVLVTDGEHRAALAVVRSLGRAGYRVIVGASTRRPLAGGSRFVTASIQLPDPLLEPGGHVDAVAQAVRQWSSAVAIPITDASLSCLLPARAHIPAVIPFGDATSVQLAADKSAVLERAAALGIHVPRQCVLRRASDLAVMDPETLRWPVVVKPARSVAEGPKGAVKLGVCWAQNRTELGAAVNRLPEGAYPVLVQQRVVGPGRGVFLLRWHGKTHALFAHERIREKPPSGGVSVCARSVAAPPDLVAQAEALLERLAWQGPAMVEFKLDAATGRAYLMEVNGRFWGSLQLAIDAGVDFPALLVAAALGQPAVPRPTWRIGVGIRWWWGEVDHLLARFRGDDLSAAREGGRGRALLTFLFPGRGIRNEVLRWDDPWPFARETIAWFAALGHGGNEP